MARAWRQRINQAGFNLGKRIVFALDRRFAHMSRVGNPAFFEREQFPWVAEVERGWPAIRRELDAVLQHREHIPNFQDLSPDQRHLSDDDGWKTFFLYAYGWKAWHNCRRCPETARLLRRIPGMKTAFFSILAPHKRLKDHRGPYKGVIRYHLALLVPEPASACGIRVGDETRHWEEGKSLIFDDTYRHEAWNDTDGVRVVLFVDFARPLRFPASVTNWLLTWGIALSPFVLGAAGKYFAWERRFERVANSKPPPP